MIDDKKILAIIPARGGSKGVIRKNIRLVADKPLIAWTIEAATSSKLIDRTIVSSENLEIIEVAKAFGADVPFIRPTYLSNDNTPGILPVLHALEEISEHYDYVVLLQPTSPLRNADDIDNAIDLCYRSGSPACVSVVETSKSPFWMYYLSDSNLLKPVMPHEEVTRRQDLPRTFALNGAVYVAKTDYVKVSKSFLCDHSVAFTMLPERSLDIDSEFDLLVADLLLSASKSKQE